MPFSLVFSSGWPHLECTSITFKLCSRRQLVLCVHLQTQLYFAVSRADTTTKIETLDDGNVYCPRKIGCVGLVV